MIQTSCSTGLGKGDEVSITINGTQVEVAQNENGHHRGVHIAVIDPSNGEVKTAGAFDTYLTSLKLQEFIARGWAPGFIVAAACKDASVSSISKDCK